MPAQLTAIGHTFSSHDPGQVDAETQSAFSNALLYAQQASSAALARTPFDIDAYVQQLIAALEPIAWQREPEPIERDVSINYFKTHIDAHVSVSDLAVTAVKAADSAYAQELRSILEILHAAGSDELQSFMNFWWNHAFRGSLRQQGMSIGPLSILNGTPSFTLYTYSFNAKFASTPDWSNWRNAFVPVLYDVDFLARWHTFLGNLSVWQSVKDMVEAHVGSVVDEYILSVPLDV